MFRNNCTNNDIKVLELEREWEISTDWLTQTWRDQNDSNVERSAKINKINELKPCYALIDAVYSPWRTCVFKLIQFFSNITTHEQDICVLRLFSVAFINWSTLYKLISTRSRFFLSFFFFFYFELSFLISFPLSSNFSLVERPRSLIEFFVYQHVLVLYCC